MYILTLLVLVAVSGVWVGGAWGTNDTKTYQSDIVDIIITTHNPGCTALYLNYTDITRVTDVRPYYLYHSYTEDELYYGINITAVIWASDLNMTMQSIVKRPDVSSVAAYSHIIPNSTETPELLAQLHDPDIVVKWMLHTECGGLRNPDIPALMNDIGWNGTEPGTDPAGPMPGTIKHSCSADDAISDEPVTLVLDPWPETCVDLETKIVYAGDLMGVEIGTIDHMAVWMYLKENGALVTHASPIMVGYIPPSLLGPLSIRDDVFVVNKLLKDYSMQEYGATTTEGLLGTNHSNVEKRHVLGHNGTGNRVGTIDIDLTTITGNDLPPQINITCHSPHNQGCGDRNYQLGLPYERAHGMALAEIIMDAAPGAEMYLTALDDEDLMTLYSVVDWLLIVQNVDVISMSLRYQFEGPDDGTSTIANSTLSAIDKEVNTHLVWFNLAGNYGDRQTWSTFGTDRYDKYNLCPSESVEVFIYTHTPELRDSPHSYYLSYVGTVPLAP